MTSSCVLMSSHPAPYSMRRDYIFMLQGYCYDLQAAQTSARHCAHELCQRLGGHRSCYLSLACISKFHIPLILHACTGAIQGHSSQGVVRIL